MRKFLTLLLLTLLASCDRPVCKQFDEFPGNRWPRTEIKTFGFDIADAGAYDISLNYSHVYGTPNVVVPLTITLKSANEIHPLDVTLKLLDDDGQPLSDCAGDVCDLSQPLLEKTQLNAGHYAVSVEQHFEYDYLPNAIGVGIEVRKSGQ